MSSTSQRSTAGDARTLPRPPPSLRPPYALPAASAPSAPCRRADLVLTPTLTPTLTLTLTLTLTRQADLVLTPILTPTLT